MTINLDGNCLVGVGAETAAMSIFYSSGEEVKAGDHILWAGSEGRVAFVVGSGDQPPEWAASEDWFRVEYGVGVMLDTKRAGLVFESDTEDLKFVERG